MRPTRGSAQRSVRQEGNLIAPRSKLIGICGSLAPAILGLFLLGTGLSGCRSKPKDTAEKPKKEEEETPLPVQDINLGKGHGTTYGNDAKHAPKWYVEWEKGKLEVGKSAIPVDKSDPQVVAKNARMETVSGYLYRGGVRSTRFTAVGGLGDNDRQILSLKGNVRIQAIDEKDGSVKATLTCDQVVYEAKGEVIKAKGHVQVVGKVGTIGTLSELWATADLKVVATPDMFKSR